MANKASWQAGLDMASESGKNKKKDDQPTDPKNGGKESQSAKGGGSGGSGGGGNPWSILTVLKKSVPSFQKGGRVRKTGLAMVHKNEFVVPAKHRSAKKAARKSGAHKRSIVKP